MTTSRSLPSEDRSQDELMDDAEKLQAAIGVAQRLTLANYEDIDDETLATLLDILKRLEDAAEDARKNGVEPELDERVAVDESVGPVTRTKRHRKYVKDEDAVLNCLREAGVDPAEAMTVKASKLVDVAEDAGLDVKQFIGRSNYTYYRRN